MSCRKFDLKTHWIRAIVGIVAVEERELTITTDKDAEFILVEVA
jgi:hypothetical protein